MTKAEKQAAKLARWGKKENKLKVNQGIFVDAQCGCEIKVVEEVFGDDARDTLGLNARESLENTSVYVHTKKGDVPVLILYGPDAIENHHYDTLVYDKKTDAMLPLSRFIIISSSDSEPLNITLEDVENTFGFALYMGDRDGKKMYMQIS